MSKRPARFSRSTADSGSTTSRSSSRGGGNSVPNNPPSFAWRYSLETTRPSETEIAALAGILPQGTPLYLTAVSTQHTGELVKAAAGLRTAGLEPVVHIAARRLAGPDALRELLARLRGEADVRRLLLIGGDVDTAGAF